MEKSPLNIPNEIDQIIAQLWNIAYSYGPSSQHDIGDTIITTSDIVKHIENKEVDLVIKKLQNIRNQLAQ